MSALRPFSLTINHPRVLLTTIEKSQRANLLEGSERDSANRKMAEPSVLTTSRCPTDHPLACLPAMRALHAVHLQVNRSLGLDRDERSAGRIVGSTRSKCIEVIVEDAAPEPFLCFEIAVNGGRTPDLNTVADLGNLPVHGHLRLMTDISGFGFTDDVAFVTHLINEIGVAGVPGSSVFSGNGNGSQIVRFCFCKKYETLEAAGARLQKLKS